MLSLSCGQCVAQPLAITAVELQIPLRFSSPAPIDFIHKRANVFKWTQQIDACSANSVTAIALKGLMQFIRLDIYLARCAVCT